MSPTPPAAQSAPLQTSLKGLKLPLTIEHFRSLDTREQNNLVSEQVMEWQLYEWDEECSSATPGAEWQNGSGYYAQNGTLWAPPYLDEELSDDEYALPNWAEAYGSRDWVNDIGAAIKLLEPIGDQEPVVCRYTPTQHVPWTWCCKVMQPRNGDALCYGSESFDGLATAIVLTCLEALGAIDNSPLAKTGAIEEAVFQAAMRGPLAGVAVHKVDCRYNYEQQTWLLEETVNSLVDGEETNCWLTQYRDGHYVFEAV